MVTAREELTPFQWIRATLGIGIPLAGVACGIALMYLAMRAVMGVGGFCAEGGAFEIRQHCPKGVPLLMFAGIWGGLIMLGLYLWQASKYHVPSLVGLAWPALFLSLGYNFLDFGLHPPGPDGGLVWGWLICAVVFGLMGGLPLLGFGKLVFQPFFRDEEPQSRPPLHPLAGLRAASELRDRLRQAQSARSTTTSPADTGSSTTGSTSYSDGNDNDSLVVALERLAALHRTGELSDIEYEAAKQRLLAP
jgi:hypothetical protein